LRPVKKRQSERGLAILGFADIKSVPFLNSQARLGSFSACEDRRELKMDISRFLKPELIKLEMEIEIECDPECQQHPDKLLWRRKEAILGELVELLQKSLKVGNPRKLLIDFVNREKKATTGIGHGIAIPHIRSMQAKQFIMGLARSKEGYDFDSLDNGAVHLFFVMAAPPYDDALYLKVFKALAEMLRFDYFREELMNAASEYEIIRAVKKME
jgi:mannitol/fructose-specific phosphotransferase system IIA component (Ntr-type)